MEVYADGSVLTARRLPLARRRRRGGGWSSRHVDKGHRAELEALAHALRSGGPWPIPLEEQLQATRISFAVERRLTGQSE